MRHLLAAVLLLASGAHAQPVADRMLGDWANADSVAQPVYEPDGAELTAEDGGPALVSLRVHLAVTDSTVTSTSVSRSFGRLQGTETVSRYGLRGDSVYTRIGEPSHVAIRSDSLVFAHADASGARAEYAYARAAPLRPPEALLGDWITEEMTDDAGVVFDLGFRFRPDGTALVGMSETPLAYRVLGPYLLLDGDPFSDPETGLVTTMFDVYHLRIEGDRVEIRAPGDRPLVLHRR